MYIYVLKCPISNVVRYVGKTRDIKGRLRHHISEAKLRAIKSHKCNWISSLLKKGLRPILEVDTVVSDLQQWKEIERQRIAYFRSLGHCLTNTTDGGDGATELSDEAKLKLVARQRQIYACPERRAAIANRMKELWADPVYREAHTKAVKEGCNKPEYLAALSSRATKYFASLEVRQNISWHMKRVCSDKDFVAKRHALGKATRSTPEYKKAASERQKANWNNPDFRVRAISRNATIARPEYKALMSKITTANNASAAYRAATAERTKASWKVPEIRARHLAGMRKT